MAFGPGKDGNFKLDNVTPTLTDISSYIDSIDFPEEVEMLETSTMGNASKTYIAGLKSATVSLSGKFDGAASAIDDLMNGIKGIAATQTFEYNPLGTAVGTPQYGGECRLASYSSAPALGSAVTWSATLQITGDVTRTTN